jgi:hypothetical protein
MCYLELPRVLVNNRSINKTLQSLRNTCTRQRTTYSKRKNCGNLFQGSAIAKEHCATERCFSGLDYQLMPKKKMSAMAWLECYPFFLVWVPEFQNTLRFLKTPGHKTAPTCSSLAKP